MKISCSLLNGNISITYIYLGIFLDNLVIALDVVMTFYTIFFCFSLLLLSRHDFPEVLRNILCVIYTVYNECLVGIGGEKLKLEHLISHLLGNVKGKPFYIT